MATRIDTGNEIAYIAYVFKIGAHQPCDGRAYVIDAWTFVRETVIGALMLL
jgi:hypothetical protein